jgi:hypothetical protein
MARTITVIGVVSTNLSKIAPIIASLRYFIKLVL